MKAFGDAVFKNVQWHMYHLDEIRNAIFWKRQEMKKHVKNMDGIRPKGVPSDPTANEAIMNSTPLKSVVVRKQIIYHPEEWVTAIEYILARLDESDRDLFKRVFQDGQKAEKVCEETFISWATFFRRKTKITFLVAVTAAERGLISLKES